MLLAVLLSLIAAWPFVVRPSLPRETDTELHVFRAAELGEVIRQGQLYTRWAPDFYYGYGYPIFNYYAPLTYYLANLLTLALPGAAVMGVRLVFILGFLAAGVGTCGLARLLIGDRGALLATTAYLFAPYIYLIDPHTRGVLAEFFALGLAPLALWLLARFGRAPTRLALIAATLSLAAALLAHNLMAPIIFALALALSAWEGLALPLLERRRPLPRELALRAAPLILALPLVMFFWLPVALESDAVQLGNLVGPGHFDFRNHFLSAGELFGFSVPLDLGSTNPTVRYNLGVGQWLLATAGLAAIAAAALGRRPPAEWAPGVFWAAGGIVFILLMLRIGQPLWEALPPMAFIQFPWRLLGPAALCLALVGGHAAHLVDRLPGRAGPIAYGTLIALPLALTLPIVVPPGWGDFGPTDRLAMLDYELRGYALGTTSTGDYLPVAVSYVPPPAGHLIASYRAGGPIDRVIRDILPPGTVVELLDSGPISSTFAVQAGQPFDLSLYLFNFAGWRASIDGEPVLISVTGPEGFIRVAVPAGEHTVRVWLGSTPPRTAGTLLSVAGLAALIVLARWMPRRAASQTPTDDSSLRPAGAAIGLFVLVALAGGLAGLFQPRSTGMIAIPAHHDTLSYLEGGINLIGYDLPRTTVRPGETLPVRLYWKAREPVPANYQVFVHLTSIPAHTWGQSDKLNPGDYPTTRWPLDRYVTDPHSLIIPPGTPPGEYTLRVGLWNHLTGVRQLVLEPDGTILGDSVALAIPITVERPRRQPDPEGLPLDAASMLEIAPGLRLLGYALDPPGSFDQAAGLLRVTLYWRAEQEGLPGYTVALRLIDEGGTVRIETASPPADGRYPTDSWAEGEVVRDVHSFWIDEGLPPGGYRLELGVLGPGETAPAGWVNLQTLQRGSAGG